MKTKRLTRWRERETLEALDRVLARSPFRAFSKLRLLDVIGPERDETLPYEDRNFLRTAHFDFVVYDRKGYLTPVFAVEFDGPYHDQEEQITRDIRKNRLCNEANLPLLRIREPQLAKHDRTTLLEFMLSRFVAWEKEAPALNREIEEQVSSMSEAELAALTENGVLDPSLDPGFLFNLDHPFPGVRIVSLRLLSDHSILTPYIRPAEGKHRCKFYCEVMQRREGSSSFEWASDTAYRLYRSDSRARPITPAPEALCEGTVRFAMQWALPVVHDYDPEETPVEYLTRTGRFPISFMRIPGVLIPDIVEWFSEYLALREVEKWALTTLRER